MATVTRNRRGVRRYTIPEGGGARVEFVHPAPHGRPVSVPLLDLSVSGLSFSYEDELPGLDSGATIPAVVVRLAGCEMHGELLVMHVTPRVGSRTVVGALFYPAQDVDLVKWKSVLAGIQATQTG